MKMKKIKNGDFVRHNEVIKTVWLHREVPEGYVFCEWQNAEGDLCHCIVKPWYLTLYEGVYDTSFWPVSLKLIKKTYAGNCQKENHSPLYPEGHVR